MVALQSLQVYPSHVVRPTKYDPAMLEIIWAYIADPNAYGDPVPTVEGACDEIGISKPTMYEWERAHTELSNALAALRAKQGRLLQSLGLMNKTNAVITKLMLASNHGMADRQELTGKEGGPIQHELLSEARKRSQKYQNDA